METRQLGTTGLTVSRMGLGLAALGRPGYINLGHARDLEQDYKPASMEARMHDLLTYAWNRGVTYFDAARSYGRAEEFLRSWIDEHPEAEGRLVVGSKWGYTYTAGWRVEAEKHEVKEHSAEELRRQKLESLDWLESHLKLYQVHSATLDSGILENKPVHQELARLKRDGVHVGLTVSGPGQAETLRQAMEIEAGGERLFETVQATWNLLERSAGAALCEAHQAGMGVLVKEGLANGRLTPRNQDPSFASKRRLLEQEAARLETTVDALALAAALAQPWVDVVLSGAAAAGHLESNLRALDTRWDEEAEEKLAAVAETPEAYWKTRGDLAWN